MVRPLLPQPWMHRAYDLALAVLVAYTTLFYDTGYDQLIGLSMALAVVFRRRAPLTVMAVVAALALTQYLLAALAEPLAGELTGYDIALLIAMVTVVIHAEETWRAYTAGAIVVVGNVLAFGGISSLSSAADWDEFNENLTFTGICAAVWLTAYVLRTRRLLVAALEERAAGAERERAHLVRLAAVEERAAIARELHDVVAHSLAVMIIQADGARYAIAADQDKASKAMQAVAGTGRDALEDMRSIVEVLRGTKKSGTDGDGDGDGGREGADDRRRVGLAHLEPLVERARAAGLHVDLRVEGEPQGLSTAEELTLFRIAQESMTNALRHAGPEAHVTVTLEFRDGTAVLEVLDDGAGKLAGSAPVLPGSGGNGLVGMRERVDVHGGRFTAGPRLGPGWQIKVELPAKAAA
ncbi:sensor histidine kinase [Streptomyces sp. V4I2]|uniref:sensor histidine kinase n=1 Tax=Streptomyces sp. V4I2 TaxID=3042280 RepID=UPI002788B02F|nr:sensor histidine kinase [Streptomyces sp. V4I2]MDQ1047208.1 signal transduction histidine kinase [Streptomyces sp. V4I2]